MKQEYGRSSLAENAALSGHVEAGYARPDLLPRVGRSRGDPLRRLSAHLIAAGFVVDHSGKSVSIGTIDTRRARLQRQVEDFSPERSVRLHDPPLLPRSCGSAYRRTVKQRRQ